MWDKKTEIHHRLALNLVQTQQRKGCHFGLLLSRTMDAYVCSAKVLCELIDHTCASNCLF